MVEGGNGDEMRGGREGKCEALEKVVDD